MAVARPFSVVLMTFATCWLPAVQSTRVLDADVSVEVARANATETRVARANASETETGACSGFEFKCGCISESLPSGMYTYTCGVYQGNQMASLTAKWYQCGKYCILKTSIPPAQCCGMVQNALNRYDGTLPGCVKVVSDCRGSTYD
uniref:Uncharacterized protein n=1 Tax=Alexandrium andersonii TaxID=327968 RepID=A0A7S2ATF0_9DINO|mmetsp:Transcript_17778/g.40178  ORF Transcript_17778/g.40178 Transcript_17778/m.40178 type:complete len:147 (+) Transcript_17778:69-509(+)